MVVAMRRARPCRRRARERNLSIINGGSSAPTGSPPTSVGNTATLFVETMRVYAATAPRDDLNESEPD